MTVSRRYEPFARISISYVESALSYAEQLPRTDYDRAMDSFRHHCHEAIYQLRLWAQASNLEILGIST